MGELDWLHMKTIQDVAELVFWDGWEAAYCHYNSWEHAKQKVWGLIGQIFLKKAG